MNQAIRPGLLLGVLAALLLYNAATLGRVPALLNDDDGTYAAAGYQFWRTGKPAVAAYKNIAGLSEDVWAFGRTAAAFEGVFLRFAGVSVFWAQLPSFLAGLGLVGLTFDLGRRLWDYRTGLLAAVLLAASGKFFEASRWARPDMLLACFFLLGLWLAATAPMENPGRRLFAAGLVMGWAGDVHVNGFLVAPIPFLVWLMLRPERNGIRLRAALSFAAAVSLGVLLWVALHYWPDPELFRRQIALYGGATHGLRIANLGLWGALHAEWQRYTDWFWAARGHRHLFEGLCILASGAWLLARGERAGRAMVAAWGAFFLIAAFFMSNPFGWYLILAWPLFALWMARASLAAPGPRLRGLALVLLLTAYLVNLGLWLVKARQDTPLRARIPELRRLIPASAPVLANGAFWFAFWDRDFTDAQYLEFRTLEGGAPPSMAEEQRKHGWRYIVAIGDLRRFVDPQVPLEELLVSGGYDARAALAREERAFSLARCSTERRWPGVSETVLVLRVEDAKDDNVTANRTQP